MFNFPLHCTMKKKETIISDFIHSKVPTPGIKPSMRLLTNLTDCAEWYQEPLKIPDEI